MRIGIGRSLALAVVLTVALTSTRSIRASAAVDSASARQPVEPAPVASLEPAKTAEIWRRLVASRSRKTQVPADSGRSAESLRGYRLPSPGDEARCLGLAVRPVLHLGASTRGRQDEAAAERRLAHPRARPELPRHGRGPLRNLDEMGADDRLELVHGRITARERMASAGYDVTKGDTWVVNELSSAVRRGTGNARANIRELLRGLYDGSGQPTRGAVFVIGVGQQTTDTSLLQTNLQNWFADSAFWEAMNTYVSDWSQEVYGDVRSHAVPGVAEQTRRDYLNDYLQHQLVLAGVGPPSIETARSYLRASHSPLANAAWERQSGYGWTMVPAQQMGAYVSSQVHALRYFSATTGQTQDHWGFAWAPRNAASIPAGEFATRSGLVLDRLAAAIRDSAETPDPADPGSAACGPPGQSALCAVDLREPA